mmetsp:Transcript_4504/g.10962  ORF Transcript_4504/g.10962 Transcript_4504/m.10962 type:complete len:457 (+) Transcript_4504:1-1371(+)
MSWYTGQDGQQIWVSRGEAVFTVVCDPEQDLPTEHLTYLATHTRKAVYQEFTVDESFLGDGKTKVQRRGGSKKQSGRQRGFILRTDGGEEVAPIHRVVPWFKAAAQELVDSQVVSRLDVEDAANVRRRRQALSLGADEVRVETSTRVGHFAHGPGFRVEITDGIVWQRLHFFTAGKEVPFQEWQNLLNNAIASTGSPVMLTKPSALPKVDNRAAELEKENMSDQALVSNPVCLQLKKDKAQEEDDDWLANLLGGPQSDDEGDHAGANEAAHQQDLQSRARDDWDQPHAVEGQQEGKLAVVRTPDWRRRAIEQRSGPHAPRQRLSAPSTSAREKQPPSAPTRSLAARAAAPLTAHSARAPCLPPQSEHGTAQVGSRPQPGQQPRSRRPEQKSINVGSQEVARATKGVASHQDVPPGASCEECGRGRPLKLHFDADYGQYFCRMCWLDFYGVAPPARS